MIEIPNLEFHAAHACNLYCAQCSHYSNFHAGGIVSVDEARANFDAWQGRLAPKQIAILGGEPTLNPELLQIIELARLRISGLVWAFCNQRFLPRSPSRFATSTNRQRLSHGCVATWQCTSISSAIHRSASAARRMASCLSRIENHCSRIPQRLATAVSHDRWQTDAIRQSPQSSLEDLPPKIMYATIQRPPLEMPSSRVLRHYGAKTSTGSDPSVAALS